MRVQVTIILPYSPPVPAQVVERLLGIAPPSEHSSPNHPWWRLDADDPRLAPLLSTLHAAGITEEPSEETSRPSVVRRLVRLVLPNRGKRPAPESKPHYRVVRIRRYEPSDCVGVAFFEPDSAVRAPTKNGRTADGRLQIDFFGAEEMSPAERAAPLLVGHCGVLVPARVGQPPRRSRGHPAACRELVNRRSPAIVIEPPRSRAVVGHEPAPGHTPLGVAEVVSRLLAQRQTRSYRCAHQMIGACARISA